MTISELQNLLEPVLWGIGGIGLLIDVIPQFNCKPVRWFFKQFGKLINPDLYYRTDEIQKSVDVLQGTVIKEMQNSIDHLRKTICSLNKKYDDKETKSMRCEIIEFADELRVGVKPSKHMYEKTFKVHDEYMQYIAENGLTNGLINADYAYIQKAYSKRFENFDKGEHND